MSILRHSFAVLVLLSTTAFTSFAAVLPRQSSNDSLLPFEITQNSGAPDLRAASIEEKRATFLYGPPVAGGPFYPTGPLADVKISADLAAVQLDETPAVTPSTLDAQLETLEDYTKLYDEQWNAALAGGPSPGVLTNYTQDLFFSMERLANSPYQIKRLTPPFYLPFSVEDDIAIGISNSTLEQLYQDGRLFYADYRDQTVELDRLVSTGTRYAAACDAYFYINAVSCDFLPLAIRTNGFPNVIYTPADSSGDWMLAKIMLSVNDLWFAQFNHLAQTHETVQINYMSAIRTLSEEHPVLGLLNRLMFEVFAIQPLAETVLYAPGLAVDKIFAFTGQAAKDYTTDRYFNKSAGAFKSNYFRADLEARGLINSEDGPELKHFPFYEDAGVIYDATEKFMRVFVNSYYESDDAVSSDHELQAWATEANGPVEAIDFPSEIMTRGTLVEILTHFAHLSTTAHHTVNTNALGHISGALPLHPAAIYKEPPTSKSNDTDPASYLPPLEKCFDQFTAMALFSRPKLVGSDRSLMHMLDDPSMLQRMNNATQAAAVEFKAAMQAFSDEVSTRTFDVDGLSQGMPFIWRDLDPNVAPWGVTT